MLLSIETNIIILLLLSIVTNRIYDNFILIKCVLRKQHYYAFVTMEGNINMYLLLYIVTLIIMHFVL